MTDANPLADFDAVVAETLRLVENIQDDQWRNPTPCTEWDLRHLVNHVVAGNLLFAANIRGTARPDRATDYLGENAFAALAESLHSLRTAFEEPGVLDRTHPTPLGPAPGTMLVHLRVNEMIGHGWDIARATDQTATYPDGVVAGALAMWQARIGSGPRDEIPFDDVQPVADDASILDRFAAYTGRRV